MFSKLDSLLHSNTSAGKLFQVTGAALWKWTSGKLSICSRDSQQQNVSGEWRRVGQDVLSGKLEHRSWEPSVLSPPSSTKCIDTVADSEAGEAAAWHHSDDLLPEPHWLPCFALFATYWWLTLGLRIATHYSNQADCLLGCTPSSEPQTTPAADIKHVWWLLYRSYMS